MMVMTLMMMVMMIMTRTKTMMMMTTTTMTMMADRQTDWQSNRYIRSETSTLTRVVTTCAIAWLTSLWRNPLDQIRWQQRRRRRRRRPEDRSILVTDPMVVGIPVANDAVALSPTTKLYAYLPFFFYYKGGGKERERETDRHTHIHK